jgi:hypothetical protein
MDANPTCEFALWGTCCEAGETHDGPLDPHHIARIKVDRKECLLALCRGCHNAGHANDLPFIVHCLWTKWKKNELDLPLLSRLKRKNMEVYLQPCEQWDLEETYQMADDIKKGQGIENG